MDLENNQEIIKKIKPCFRGFIFFYLTGLLVIIFSFFFIWYYFFLGFVIIVIFELFRRSHTYYLSQKGITEKFNFISQRTIFVNYSKIQDIGVKQGFWAKLLNIGQIEVNTAGSDKVELVLINIKDPYSIKKLIQERIS